MSPGMATGSSSLTVFTPERGNVRFMQYVFIVVASMALLAAGCSEKTPSRDHIPLLKERVYLLQEAVNERDRAAIDSLMSPKISSHKQGPDSLLRFVYGPDGLFAFERFGDCRFVYTRDKARIDCFVMDSTGGTDRPIEFTFVLKHDLWLLKRFEVGQPAQDSL